MIQLIILIILKSIGRNNDSDEYSSQDQDSIMISESDDKSILSTTCPFISGYINKNDVSSSRNNNNNVNDVIQETIDKDKNCDYNKDDLDPPTPQHATDETYDRSLSDSESDNE